MYYDNKSKFYLRQYGPLILVIVLSVALIGCGVYIFLAGNTPSTPPKDVVVAQDDLKDKSDEQQNNTTDSPKTEEPKEDDGELLTIWLDNMQALEKSDDTTVESVDESNNIIVKLDGKTLKLTLIGLDYTKSISNINEKLNEDLKGKTVKIAFDNKKTDDKSIIYAYVYIDDVLYNETALDNGYTKLSDVGENNSLLNTLKQAQAYAKQTTAGVWNVE